MRALFGGVVGAGASTAAWLAFEHFQQANYGWLVCLIGLITGMSVHRAAGKAASGGGFARGELATVLTLAAIVGGQQVYAKIMQATSSAAAAVTAGSAKGQGADGEGDAKTGADADAPAAVLIPEINEATAGAGQRGYSKSNMKKNLSDWDMVWMCVAALAAYVTGKGNGNGSGVKPSEEDSEPQQAAEQAEAETEEA